VEEPKEKLFLEYNREEILKNLLAVEGHLRNLDRGDRAGFTACIVKHLMDAEGHADEAISHAAVVEGSESSRRFRELRDRIRDYRRLVQMGVGDVEEAIRGVRAIRRYFESFNPQFDISRCAACGIPEAMERPARPGLREAEEEMAERVLEHLSAKYGVPKPKLRILERCPTHPTDFGLYSGGPEGDEIVLCRGGASVHVLLHEFAHYLGRVRGRIVDEEEAERFAANEELGVEKGFNMGGGKNMIGESMPIFESEFKEALPWATLAAVIDGALEAVWASNPTQWSGKFPYVPTYDPYLPPADDWLVLLISAIPYAYGVFAKSPRAEKIGESMIHYSLPMIVHHTVLRTTVATKR
jgi:hypothetical protein